MKTVVFAYHNMGLAGLESLLKHSYDVAAVFSHEDDPRENVWFGSVKEWAIKNEIECYTTKNVNSPEWISKIASMHPDVIFSFYYRNMICREILDLPPIGAFNLHGSYLPYYRGRCPVNWVLVNGEKKSGVTLHYMIEKPDAGDIVGQKAVSIDVSDTARSLYGKLCAAAGDLLDDVLPLIKKEQIPRLKQNLNEGSYYGGRRPEDGRIDWKKSADEIYNLVRGVTEPYPGAFAYTDGDEKIVIWWTEPVMSKEADPGKMIITDKEILVQAGKNAIKLMDIEVGEGRLKGEQIYNYFKNGKVLRLK